MKILPPEPQVELYKEGFEERDILQRAGVGKTLSDLMERIEDPLVVALEGGWGTGKTYFLKRWVGAHTLSNGGKATTVYFDAFANDYLDDPLPALVSTLSKRFPSTDEDTVRKLKSAAFRFAKPLARFGLAMATFGATEALAPIGDAAINAMSDEASNALETYWSQEDGRRAAMDEFHSALAELVATQPDDVDDKGSQEFSGARLIIVIDELDRCRPDYALGVLEVIKHFFSIPGVTFVLGVNLIALENSVRARYGADIDASAYLRKFINVSLSLPSEIGGDHSSKNAIAIYLDHYIKEMGVPNHIAESLRPHVHLVARRNAISVRDVGKILSSISLLSDEILTNDRIYPGWLDVAITLVVSRVVCPKMFEKFLNATVSESDLEEYFDATLPRLNRRNGDETNPDYDHYAWIQFNSWKYLVNGGELPGEDPHVVQGLGRTFSQFGRLDDPRSLPRKVHRKWLNIFTATSS